MNEPSRIKTSTPSVVIVLEPDVLIRSSVSDFLRECGYRVIEGVSAVDAWIVIQSGQQLDVVFSEVRLVGTVNGFSLARSLRQTHPEIDVILTSGIDDAAEKSSELCEQGPVRKPYHPQSVETRIRVLLERRRSAKKD